MITHEKFHKSPGFTLFELILVMAIMAVMAVSLLASATAGQATLAAQRSTQLIVEALREAQNSALGAKKVAGTPSVIPRGGWGVSFHTGSNPILFADLNCDHQYEATAVPTQCPNQSGAVADVLVRTIVLDANAPITALSATGVTGNLDVTFLPPNPNVYINGTIMTTTPLSPSAIVTLTATSGGVVVKQVYINAIGSISVQ